MDDALAVLSDLHGNLHALQAVLADVEEQGIREVVCLGDVVGYGGKPAECVEVLRAAGIRYLRGNHDAMVASSSGMDGLTLQTRLAVEWTASVLSVEQRAWLAELPMTLEGDDWEAVHACLHRADDWPYVLTADMAALHFTHQSKPLCFIGHTHRPAMWVEGEALGVDITSIENLRAGKKCLVNAGAVGQPRDRDARACYAVYRRGQRDIWWRRVAYDVTAAQKAIHEAGLPPYFAQRLELGR